MINKKPCKVMHIYAGEFENLCRGADEPRVACGGQLLIFINDYLNMYGVHIYIYDFIIIKRIK